MNDLQILCMIEAAKSGSFMVAAEKMYMTPPTFGRYISSLEDELGYPLFVRGKQLRLTPAGELMYKGFVELRDRIEELKREAERINAGKSGKLSLGMLEGQIIDDRLRGTLGYFRSVYPELEIQLSRWSFRELEERLMTGKLDMGITLTAEIVPLAQLDHAPFQTLKNYLVLPKDHPLARKDSLALSDLKDVPLLELDAEECGNVSRTMIECCRAVGFEPKLLRFSDLKSQLFALEAGLGMMPLNENHMACHNPNLTIREVEGLPIADFCIAWNRSNPNPAIQLFLEHL